MALIVGDEEQLLVLAFVLGLSQMDLESLDRTEGAIL